MKRLSVCLSGARMQSESLLDTQIKALEAQILCKTLDLQILVQKHEEKIRKIRDALAILKAEKDKLSFVSHMP